eukprot:TRINITY_DN6625_c0_g1_i1.p8 TRINITY_DN6625_c0_g1~~TRINITY_DN6625_c0_g1_i1.p8  ORF type:complete len:206 (-),score=28.05 TRINITY_DN6625_c0_g1_i1:3195-3812(-)
MLAWSLKSSESLDRDNTTLFVNPMVYRAVNGAFHTLVADKLWLDANSVSEMSRGSSYSVDSDEFKAAFKTITVMDPYFFQAINYATTYLATIKNDLDGAVELIDEAESLGNDDFRLLFLKMLLIATYDLEGGMEEVEKLSKELLSRDDKKVFGVLLVDEYIEELYLLSTSKSAKTKQKKDDLLWLYKHTQNLKIKAEVQKKLENL